MAVQGYTSLEVPFVDRLQSILPMPISASS